MQWLEAIKAQGRALVEEAFTLIDARIDDDGRLFGDDLTVADAALFYVTFWADRIGLPLPPRCLAFYRRMRERPVVRRVLAEEGYR
jgi:glutathione S-transferase